MGCEVEYDDDVNDHDYNTNEWQRFHDPKVDSFSPDACIFGLA